MGRLVVLVHGLFETEHTWSGRGTGPSLIAALTDEPTLTTVLVRYNTGLPVDPGGEELADLLEGLVSEWPVPIQSIALVGHSMGGLVATAACLAGRASGHAWVGKVTDVVAIGSPFRGVPLEKLLRVVARGLGVARQTRPLAAFLDGRSAGIRDLGYGIDAATSPGAPMPRHHLIAGVVTADPDHVVGRVVGDLIVRPGSGTRPPGMTAASVVVVGGANHFTLPHHPVVIDYIMRQVVGTRVPSDPAS